LYVLPSIQGPVAIQGLFLCSTFDSGFDGTCASYLPQFRTCSAKRLATRSVDLTRFVSVLKASFYFSFERCNARPNCGPRIDFGRAQGRFKSASRLHRNYRPYIGEPSSLTKVRNGTGNQCRVGCSGHCHGYVVEPNWLGSWCRSAYGSEHTHDSGAGSSRRFGLLTTLGAVS
jgi:hypothetical protein